MKLSRFAKHYIVTPDSLAARNFQNVKDCIANDFLVTVEKEGTIIVETDAS